MIGIFGIIEPCHHEACPSNKAFVYCSLLAVSYVGCLYVFVPSTIRKFSRDHPTHIRYRSQACLIVCVLAILSYPSIFCADNDNDNDNDHNNNNNNPLFSVARTMLLPPFSLRDTFGVLLHSCILYTGSSVASLLYTYELRKRLANPMSLSDQIRGYVRGLIPDNEQRFWIGMRNYVLAPWTEEIIFRGCMIPVLLASGISRVALVAPLFFGVAHLHHAFQKLSNGEKPKTVILVTAFQFLYTSLFGSYASHAFCRVGSVLSITLSHSYCNWMGLPDFGFVNPRHPLYRYRGVLFLSYLCGIAAFWYLFRVDTLLPLPSKLQGLINSTQETE